jgi:ADP-heptose:LPS heptosyltransferase
MGHRLDFCGDVRIGALGTVPALPTRLLLDMPHWLGDFAHTLPALTRLAAGNARGRTAVLLPEAHARLARLLGVDTVARPGDAGFWWAHRHLQRRYDIVVSARHATRAKLLLRGADARRTLASRGRGATLLGLTTFAVDRSRHQRHDLDGALRQLRLDPVDDSTWRFRMPDGPVAVAREALARAAGAGAVVALLPGSSAMPAKRYPVEGFVAVARLLAECHVTCVVVTGPGQEHLAAAVAAGGAAIALPVEPLDDVAAMFAGCAAVIGNDSGLTHLAAVVGCPTIALFGPTDPHRTGPVGGAIVMRAPRGSLREIQPSQITATVLALLLGARPNDHDDLSGSPG